MFSAPLKILTDVEYKKGNFGFLVRGKAWYDYALENEKVRIGNQVNNYNGGRPDLDAPNYGIPGSYPPCVGALAGGNVPTCMPITGPNAGKWPEAKLSDQGFETEQKFTNAMLLDAYVYGSFDFEGTDLQLRLGNQVVNWGESIFIQGVNQINPIDVPAARRPGTELKEILLPVWMAYANWGFDWGSIEAFHPAERQDPSTQPCPPERGGPAKPHPSAPFEIAPPAPPRQAAPATPASLPGRAPTPSRRVRHVSPRRGKRRRKEA